MAIVVRPRRSAASCGAPAYVCSLYTCQTKPEQSKPPGAWTPNGASGPGLVPPQTYGYPISVTAVCSTFPCHGVGAGSENAAAASCTDCESPPSDFKICATEYAASARVAG